MDPSAIARDALAFTAEPLLLYPPAAATIANLLAAPEKFAQQPLRPAAIANQAELKPMGNAPQSPVMLPGGIAVIHARGLLMREHGMLARFGLATSTVMLCEDMQALQRNDKVRSIILLCDSPGGLAMGNEECAAAIAAGRGTKPMQAVVTGLCASAMYYIAAAFDSITAGPSTLVGSPAMNVQPLPKHTAHLVARGLQSILVYPRPVRHRGEPAIAAVADDQVPVPPRAAELLTAAGVSIDRLPTGIVCLVDLIDCEPIPRPADLPAWLGTTFPPEEAPLVEFTRGDFVWHLLLIERIDPPTPWQPTAGTAGLVDPPPPRPASHSDAPAKTYPGKCSASETSLAAYQAIQGALNELQQLVYDTIDAHSLAGGITRDGVAAELDRAANTITPRVRELLDASLVIETGRRRETRTGHTAKLLITARHAK
jgi:hypothetical protein